MSDAARAVVLLSGGLDSATVLAEARSAGFELNALTICYGQRHAVELEAARRVLAEGRPHAGIELLFTMQEEVGLQGAAAFDQDRLLAQIGYVYDQAAPIGEIILGAPWSQAMQVRFHGRAAHSGMFPEDGRSAIQAAAKAIADLRLGRIDDETTANVGLISGGTGGTIVPEWCTFSAEARCQDERKLQDIVQEMLDAFTFAATEAECEVETEMFARYRLAT